jgi:hypothetical protein
MAEVRTVAAMAAALVALGACSPGGPPGVKPGELDDAVSKAIGDSETCVLIGERGSGKVLYRYNTATTCSNEWPACDRPERTSVGKLLDAAAKDGQVRLQSCYTLPDRSRSVGWAAGPIPGRDWVYAAVMQGERAFPGRMMADRLATAFDHAKVSRAAPSAP